jgi:hypothetical protein
MQALNSNENRKDATTRASDQFINNVVSGREIQKEIEESQKVAVML